MLFKSNYVKPSLTHQTYVSQDFFFRKKKTAILRRFFEVCALNDVRRIQCQNAYFPYKTLIQKSEVFVRLF